MTADIASRPPSAEKALHLRWPAERFYWAVLDASALTGATMRPGHFGRQLGYLFEGVLPGMTIEQVHAVYQPLPSGGGERRYLACGLARDVIQDTVAAEALTLSPASLPSFVGADVEPDAFNLLTGSFLPAAVRALQRRWLLSLGVIAAICVALLVVGIELRVGAIQAQIDQVAAARDAALVEALGPQALAAATLPPELRLTTELRLLSQTRQADPAVVDVTDASRTLAALLARWPADVRTATESISIAPDSITIVAQVPAMADAQRLADAMGDLSGWQLVQPQSEARRDHVMVTLHLRAAPVTKP